MRLLYCTKAGFASSLPLSWIEEGGRDRDLISAIAVSIGYHAAADKDMKGSTDM